jgi:hypothetical protein
MPDADGQCMAARPTRSALPARGVAAGLSLLLLGGVLGASGAPSRAGSAVAAVDRAAAPPVDLPVAGAPTEPGQLPTPDLVPAIPPPHAPAPAGPLASDTLDPAEPELVVPGAVAPAEPAEPAAASSGAVPASVTSDEQPPTAAAEMCPALVVRAQAPRTDGTVAAGAVVLALGPDRSAAGRTVDWSLAPTSGAATSGTVVLDRDGAAQVAVTLTAGTWTSSAQVRFSGDVPGACPALTGQVTAARTAAWASGASGAGVADGTFGTWRGSPTAIAGTWSDNNEAQVGLWQLRPGFEYATWRGDLDIAVGAIGPGETWTAAARGDYDARWTQSLQELSRLWSGRPGTLYIRFAHEFNGDWYPWRVTNASAPDFVTAWQRYRALQQRWFPTSQLVFSPNSESSSGVDWRRAFPGAAAVDVMAVDYYNQWPWVDTAVDFQRLSLAYDGTGAPRGLQRHLEFARSVGLPFAVAEWGNNGSFGDSGVYVEQMHDFFARNAGTGPGQLRYEIYFNVVWDGNPFGLFPTTGNPRAAEAYQRAF